MGLKQLLRRLLDDRSEVVEKASKIEKEVLQIDPLERIAELKRTGANIAVEVERIGADGSGYSHKNFEIDEVEPLAFRDLIAENLGGGSYRLTFRKAEGQIMRRSDTGKPETYEIKVGGKAKGKGKADKADKKKDELPGVYQVMMEQQNKNMEMIMTMQTTMITGLLGNMGNGKGDPAAIVKTLIEGVKEMKAVAGDGGIDPIQLVSGVMQLMKQYESQTRAPVQTTGSGNTGMEKFFEGLGAAIPSFAPLIASRLNSGTPAGPPAALPADTNVPGSTPTPDLATASPAGAADNAPSSAPAPLVNPLDALSAPLGQVQGGGSDPSHAAYGALMKLRYMIAQRDEPLSIAAEMVDSINLVMGSQRIAGRWQNFINEDNVGTLFDQYAPMIPEFAADEAFTAECRAALIEAVHDQLNPESDVGPPTAEEEEEAEGETQEEAANEVDDSPDEPEEVSTESEAADDSPDGNSGNHEGRDGDGRIDG